ncbi:MAG TPA: thiolase family protein [Candidatus Dormibacteraeota bacterium]|nr:thiolase family protein [Candidatus Dormibacteraeota bacterium]
MREVWIRGAAMTRFARHVDRTARDLVEEAVAGALADAGLDPADVQAAYVGNAAAGLIGGQESIRGQVVLRHTGLLGVPIVNVENADASSSTALHMAWQAVAGGLRDCVVVLGYEKLDHRDRSRISRAMNATMDLTELADVFGSNAGQERNVMLDLSGATSSGDGQYRFDRELLAEVAVKNRHHGSLNPCAHLQTPVTAEQVLASRTVAGPLTKLMCAPFSDGAACLVLGSADFRRGRRDGVRIVASVLASGRGDDLRRPPSAVPAVREAYELAAAGPEDLDVIELHDATSVIEMYVYERLSLCPPDEVGRLVRERTTWLGGRLPVNPSGGLIARGHPMGATGAAQIVELAWQLEGRCGARQVPSARLGLAYSVGGWVGSDVGACCVHVLQR